MILATAAGAGSEVTQEFLWRRLGPIRNGVFVEWQAYAWLFLLAVVLLVALFYVMWMYIKDSSGRGSFLTAVLSTFVAALIITPAYVLALVVLGTFESDAQLAGTIAIATMGLIAGVAAGFGMAALVGGPNTGGVGKGWGMLLAVLRLSVYTILALLFLLPAIQSSLITRTDSKVIVVWDVSASLHTSDDTPTGQPGQKMTTRMDLVREFLKDPEANFLPALQKKNPVTVYRFGSKLDEDYLHFSKLNDDGTSRAWTREEKEKPRDGKEEPVEPSVRPLGEEYWKAWLNPMHTPEGGVGNLEVDRLAKLHDRNQKLVKEGFQRGTNIADSLAAVINRERNNRPQGIVVFTDGRNTEGSPNGFTNLANLSRDARIPIFVIAVGEDREKIKVDIVDTRTSPQIQPEDRYRLVSEITGEGLAGKEVRFEVAPGKHETVALEITHVRTYKAKTKVKENGKEKVVEEEREELLPIELIERENPEDPKAKRDRIPLGERLVLPPQSPVALDKGSPPRATVEWQLDAATLALAKGINLEDEKYKSKKWEIGETKEDSELKYRITVPRVKGEAPPVIDKKDVKLAKKPEEIKLRQKYHVGERVGMKVSKKPLRVLLFAGAANRDYQFVQALLAREMDKKRLELAIHLQPPPGQAPRVGVVQSVPKERLLHEFPETFNKKKDLTDLSSFDVIVAFDPDWNRLSPAQIRLTKNWAEQGGGLVVVGGHINTVELIRPRDDNTDHFKPILDLLPVYLGDRRELAERKTDDPFALDLSGATRELEFLKLDEELDDSKFTEDWRAFFYGTGKERRDTPVRGFYSIYPLTGVRTTSIVVARFTDPDPQLRLKDGTMQPFIVVTPDELPRVIWIGSAETWRLREYKEAFHERFWTKLVQYAGSKSKGGVSRGIRPEFLKSVPQNRPFPVEARIDAPDGSPADRNIKPEITLKMPAGVDPKEVRQPILMTPHAASKGWFSGRFVLKSPGEYEATIRVPKQAGQDSDMFETFRFTVTEANPELDNTRPDFDRMYRMASEVDVVRRRMSDSDIAELKRRLVRPAKLSTGGDAVDSADRIDISDDKMRLYFELTRNAALVPTCMMSDPQKAEIRGPRQDLWDGGFMLGRMPLLGWFFRLIGLGTAVVAWMLLLVVGLLSTEWLIRKLLRLA